MRLAPGTVSGRFRAPASKSCAIRLLACASLSHGECALSGLGRSRDVATCVALCRALGARVEARGAAVLVQGPLRAPPAPLVLSCGESALCLRVFACLGAALGGRIRLEAEGSLAVRPLLGLEEALGALGARCRSNGGYPPVEVEGPFMRDVVEVDASGTSQVASGLLLALAAAGGGRLTARDPVSAPYLALTLQSLASAGIAVEAGVGGFQIAAGQRARPFRARIEGDWSAAAFPLVAAATAGEVVALGLNPDSVQADRALLAALRLAGARVEVGPDGVRVGRDVLRPFAFDLTPCPDLAPPLAALAAACPGTSTLTGAGRLRAKESDRGAALEAQFARLGVRVERVGEALRVHGGPVRGGAVEARGDHRIAMALGILALRAEGEVRLTGAGAVAKSWPGFWRVLGRLRG